MSSIRRVFGHYLGVMCVLTRGENYSFGVALFSMVRAVRFCRSTVRAVVSILVFSQMNDTEHDKSTSVRGETHQMERFGVGAPRWGHATHSHSFLNKSTVFLKAIGGED